ncbi:MAG TPA: helix-hairpin-helix domain-containing protein [Prolixibacteraceae bacterium]|jgi:DNA uptake protein ComE-like DNA-binding protein
MKINWIRELFSFSKKERRGIVSLLLIIFILIVVGKLIPLFIPSEKTDFSKWEEEVKTYLSNNEKPISGEKQLHLVEFNPNEVDSGNLANMGVPSGVAANWLKYIEKGGRFRDNDEVKKIYGMTPSLFNHLDSFMVIPKGGPPQVNGSRKSFTDKSNKEFKRDTIFRPTFSKFKKEPVNVIELNSADSIQLLAIPGIGPVFASRIIRYRNLLGGYYTVEQLREVYGMREENFTAVAKYFTANPSSLKTFNINFSTVRELGRHPYVGFKTARKIFNLRDKKGKFSSPEDLSAVVASDSLKRLIPYVKFSQ